MYDKVRIAAIAATFLNSLACAFTICHKASEMTQSINGKILSTRETWNKGFANRLAVIGLFVSVTKATHAKHYSVV